MKNAKIAGRLVVLIPLDACFVDPRVQRGKKIKHVNAMTKDDHDPKAVRNIVVSKRNVARTSKQRYSIIDGQHRVAMLREEGYTHVYAEIHEGLTVEEEAKLFELLNRTSPVTTMDKFRVAMIQKDSVESQIDGIVNINGCKLKLHSDDQHVNLISGIGAIRSAAIDRGIPHVKTLMRVLMVAFSTNGILQTKAKESRFLAGLSLAVWDAEKREMTADQIAHYLSVFKAVDVLQDARDLAAGSGFKEIDSVAKILAVPLMKRRRAA